MFESGNLLWVFIFCGTVLLSLALFLLYLRCIVKNYMAKRNNTISSRSSPILSEMLHGQQISTTTDVDCETETTDLALPHQESRLSKSKALGGSDFFRLPSDRRNATYYQFGIVDDIDANEMIKCYPPRSSRSVAHFGRKGCRLYRKGTWDRSVVRILANNVDDGYKRGKEQVVVPIVTFTPSNSRHSYYNLMQNESCDFQTVIWDKNKEVLI